MTDSSHAMKVVEVHHMSKSYSIQEVSVLTGLPESTLRYYESIGIIPYIRRDHVHKRRRYEEADVHLIDSLACLTASGMSINELREYMKHREGGALSAVDQIALFRMHEQQLKNDANDLAVRLEFARLKVAYWQAVDANDAARVTALSHEIRGLGRSLKVQLSVK